MLRQTFILIAIAVVAAQSQTPGPSASGKPARDMPAQQKAVPQTASIMGRVVAADSGRPLPRVRVSLSAPQGGGKVTLTDDAGACVLTDLPDGRYTLQASKSGFITIQYGQRRPLQPGTPIQLVAGQALRGVNFSLPWGGAISGTVTDERGEPMPGIPVLALAYRYTDGARTLTPVRSAQTDDRGEYRVWGLNPGDYYISVTPSLYGGSDSQPIGYAPTYYPGATAVSDARPVTVGLSTDTAGISFNVTLVRTAHVLGHLINADGTPGAAAAITLVPDDAGRVGSPTGRGFGASTTRDGQFAFSNIPPGHYMLRARSGNVTGRGRSTNGNDTPTFASTQVSVGGDDIDGIEVVLAAGAGISGTATFLNTQGASPPVSQFRVAAPPTTVDGAGNSQTQIDPRTGAFNIDGLAPGEHVLHAQTPAGWSLKSTTIDRRDITDRPFDLKSGQKITTVVLVFTDRVTEIQGTVRDTKGNPVTDFTVLAFSQDESLWRPPSRDIMTARPDQNGQYQIQGLPSGDYNITLIDPDVQGEWFDPAFLESKRAGAQRIHFADGDVHTQDFVISR